MNCHFPARSKALVLLKGLNHPPPMMKPIQSCSKLSLQMFKHLPKWYESLLTSRKKYDNSKTEDSNEKS